MNYQDFKFIPLFAELEDKDLKKIEEISSTRQLAKGDTIFNEGDPGDAFYIIESGKVDIIKNINGVPKTIASIGKGDFFGEMALIEGEPRSASVMVAEDSVLAVITKTNFNYLIKVSPSILLRIMTFLSKRLRRDIDEIPVTGAGGGEIHKSGNLITSFSAKGGVGKSVMAVNVATALALYTGKKVILWDLDLLFGDISILLNLKSTRSIASLVAENTSLNWEELEGYIFHLDTGLDVLPAPARPEESETITLQHVTRIMEILKKKYDYIICDAHSSFNDVTIALLDKSDQIVLLLTLDLPTIKNSKLCVDVMRNLNYDDAKVKLVVNHLTQFTRIHPKDVENKLKLKANVTIPFNDELVISSVDNGVPFVKFAPDSNISKGVFSLCELLAGSDFQRKAESGFMGKIKGFFGS